MTKPCTRCGSPSTATPHAAPRCPECDAAPAPRAATGARNDDSVLFSIATLRDVGARVSAPVAVTRSTPTPAPRRTKAKPARTAVDEILTVGCAQPPLLAPLVIDTPATGAARSAPRSNRAVVLASAAAAVLVVQGALAAAVLTRGARDTGAAAVAGAAVPRGVHATAQRVSSPAPSAQPPAADRVLQTPDSAQAPPAAPERPASASAHVPPRARPVSTAATARPVITPAARVEPPAASSASRCVATCRGDADCLMRCSVGTPLAIPAAPATSTAPSRPAPDATSLLPATPSRADVLAALAAVRAPVQRCAAGQRGTATLAVTFASSGRVTTATVAGPYAGTPQGSCMARAARAATLPPFARATFTVNYPVAIP